MQRIRETVTNKKKQKHFHFTRLPAHWLFVTLCSDSIDNLCGQTLGERSFIAYSNSWRSFLDFDKHWKSIVGDDVLLGGQVDASDNSIRQGKEV